MRFVAGGGGKGVEERDEILETPFHIWFKNMK